MLYMNFGQADFSSLVSHTLYLCQRQFQDYHNARSQGKKERVSLSLDTDSNTFKVFVDGRPWGNPVHPCTEDDLWMFHGCEVRGWKAYLFPETGLVRLNVFWKREGCGDPETDERFKRVMFNAPCLPGYDMSNPEPWRVVE